MAGNWQTTKGFISKASLLQSTGADRANGKENFTALIKEGIKNVNRPYPNHKEGYVGAVLALEFTVGPKKLYFDVLIEEGEHRKFVDMLGMCYIINSGEKHTNEDIHIPLWDAYVVTNREIFIKVKIDTKDGKTYTNVVDIGPTKSSVEFQQKTPTGFAPANPFAGMKSKIERTHTAAPTPIATPTAHEPSADLGAGHDDVSEIPF